MAVFVNYIVPAVHVGACVFLIVVVLLQQGKGADVGAVFGGGGSQTLFGASGAGNFLTRLTTGMAIAFMITSLILTYGQTHAVRSGILDKIPASAAIPAAPPAGGTDTAAAPPAEAPAATPPAAQEQPAETPPPAADNAPSAPVEGAPAK